MKFVQTQYNATKEQEMHKRNAILTASLEVLILSCTIDAKEGRDVAMVDVPNAFLHSLLPKDQQVILKIMGSLAEILVSIAPRIYRKYVVMKNGQKILYVRLKKVLYGLLQAALLFYKKLS